MATSYEVEPGASLESALIISHTDSCDDFQQMGSSLEEIRNSNNVERSKQEYLDNCNNVEVETEESLNYTKVRHIKKRDDTTIRDEEWLEQSEHVFVLSSAGKPIYSRYGHEDRFSSYFSIMQALVSFVEADDDSIHSIHAGDSTFVFLFKEPLILVAISKTEESVAHLTSQLNYVFSQIVSMLTLTHLVKIYEQRRNYDLRRLLTGAERLVDRLLDFSEKEPAFILGAVECLPLNVSVRNSISSAIVQSCSKIKNLVFGILLADNRLITLIRMKKYFIHPHDLHLIFNLVQSSESLKTAESWTPLCLPRFDSGGFLYGHVSYLAEDCQACLLLLTVERDAFFSLSEAKKLIVERLRRGNCMEAINESLATKVESCKEIGFPEFRHYLYKCKSTSQFYQPSIGAPCSINVSRLLSLYRRAHYKLKCPTRPLKLLFERNSDNCVFIAWDTRGFELYAVLEPLMDTNTAIGSVVRLLNWIKEHEERLFHLNAPTF